MEPPRVLVEVERDVSEVRCWEAVVVEVEVARRLAAWYLSYRMTSSTSASVRMCSFRAFSLSRASRSSNGPVLLLLDVGFRLPLKAGMESGELAPKHELSKIGLGMFWES